MQSNGRTDTGRRHGSHQVETMRELIVAVRNIRAEMEVPAKDRGTLHRELADARGRFLESSEALVRELAGFGARVR